MKSAKLAALCFVVFGACVGTTTEETPETPDLSGLVQQYQEPTADLDVAVFAEILAELNESLSLNEDMDGLKFIRDNLIAPAMMEAETEGERIISSLDGFFRIRHICKGLDLQAPPNEELNGSIEMVVAFTEQGFNRVIFGAAQSCRYLVGGDELFIDGPLRYDRLDFLFSADMRIEIGGALTAMGPLSFRSPEDGSLELLLTRADGTHLTFIVNAARSTASFRAANGDWECDLVQLECTDPEGARVSIQGLNL